MPRQHKGSLLRAARQEGEATMKQFTAMIFACFMLLTVTAVILGTRKDLCEIRFRTRVMEVAVSMACESVR